MNQLLLKKPYSENKWFESGKKYLDILVFFQDHDQPGLPSKSQIALFVP